VLKRAESSLDEGNKALAIRRKHIKIADCSDLSCAMVRHYITDPLADGPEDEKEIARSEKEARKEFEQAKAKKSAKRGGGRQRSSRQDYNRDMRFDPYTDYGRRERFAQPTYVNGAHHLKGNFDRLYLPRDMGGRGFLSTFDVVECEKGLSQVIYIIHQKVFS